MEGFAGVAGKIMARMRYRRLRTLDEVYQESHYALILFIVAITIVPLVLCAVKFFYPSLLTWSQIIVLPLAVSALPAAGLLLNAARFRRLKRQERDNKASDSG